MGKLESITTLATIAVGGLVFLKVYPLLEGFLKGGAALPQILPSNLTGKGTILGDNINYILTGTGETATVEDFGGASVEPEVQAALLAGNAANTAAVVEQITGGAPATPQDFLQAGNVFAMAGQQVAAQPAPAPVQAAAIPLINDFIAPLGLSFPKPAQEVYRPTPLKPIAIPSAEVLQTMQFQALIPQESGSYWANPITGASMGAYVRGQTPQEVLDLRANDIFPSIRGY